MYVPRESCWGLFFGPFVVLWASIWESRNWIWITPASTPNIKFRFVLPPTCGLTRGPGTRNICIPDLANSVICSRVGVQCLYTRAHTKTMIISKNSTREYAGVRVHQGVWGASEACRYSTYIHVAHEQKCANTAQRGCRINPNATRHGKNMIGHGLDLSMACVW